MPICPSLLNYYTIWIINNLVNMKKLFFVILLSLSYSAIGQYLWIQNFFDEPMYVCVSYQTTTNGWTGWISQGWWKLIPGERKAVIPLSSISCNLIYVYSRTGRNSNNPIELVGKNHDFTMIIDLNNGFKIQNCFSEYVIAEHPEYVKVCPWVEAIDIRKPIFSRQKDQTIVLDKYSNSFAIDTMAVTAVEDEVIIPRKKTAYSASKRSNTRKTK